MIIEKVAQTGTTDSNYQLGTVLWENEHPDQEFGAQDIILSSDDYDYLELYFHFGISSETASMAIIKIKKGDKTYASYSMTLDNGTLLRTYTRNIEFVDDVTLNMSDCYMRENTTAVVSGASMIPVTIIGYKNTIPTVVRKEGEVYDDQERVVGTWFGKPLYRKVIVKTAAEIKELSKDSANRYLLPVQDLNIDLLMEAKTICEYDDGGSNLHHKKCYSSVTSSSVYDMTILGINNGYILCRYADNILNYVTSNIYIPVEYTKTTD